MTEFNLFEEAAPLPESCLLDAQTVWIPTPSPSQVEERGQAAKDARNAPPSLVLVPQRPYSPRCVGFQLLQLQPIEFFVRGRKGLNLRDALRDNFAGLSGQDDRIMQDRGTKVSYRLEVRRRFLFFDSSFDLLTPYFVDTVAWLPLVQQTKEHSTAERSHASECRPPCRRSSA